MFVQESGSTRAPSVVPRLIELLGRECRDAAYDRGYADVVAFIQIRQTEADHGASVTRFNLIKERAFQHFAGAFDEPMSRQAVPALLLRTASLRGRDQKYTLGPERGDPKDLAGAESALRRIFAWATSHPRQPSHLHETYQSSTRASYLCLEGGAGEAASDEKDADSNNDTQVAYSAYLTKKKKEFDAEYPPARYSHRQQNSPRRPFPDRVPSRAGLRCDENALCVGHWTTCAPCVQGNIWTDR